MSDATLPKQSSSATLAEQLDYAKQALERGDFMLARTLVGTLTAGTSGNDRQKVNRFMRNLRVDPVAIITALTVAIGLALVATVTVFH